MRLRIEDIVDVRTRSSDALRDERQELLALQAAGILKVIAVGHIGQRMRFGAIGQMRDNDFST